MWVQIDNDRSADLSLDEFELGIVNHNINLDKQEIALGSKIEIIFKESFDLSTKIKVNEVELTISNKIANNLYVKVG